MIEKIKELRNEIARRNNYFLNRFGLIKRNVIVSIVAIFSFGVAMLLFSPFKPISGGLYLFLYLSFGTTLSCVILFIQIYNLLNKGCNKSQ